MTPPRPRDPTQAHDDDEEEEDTGLKIRRWNLKKHFISEFEANLRKSDVKQTKDKSTRNHSCQDPMQTAIQDVTNVIPNKRGTICPVHAALPQTPKNAKISFLPKNPTEISARYYSYPRSSL